MSTVSHEDEWVSLFTDERLAPYLRESGGDQAKALELYAWNARISAACMEVVAYLEVMLRNAADRELQVLAREDERRIPWFMVPAVTGSAHEVITEQIEITRARLRGIGAHRDSRGQIVAGLSFGFWAALFGSKHEELWRSALSRALPGTPGGRRKTVTATLDRLRPFRNRLAHHDSLLSQDIVFQLREMLMLAEWISPAALAWLEQHENVTDLYRTRPVTPPDTLVVPAALAWPLYLTDRVYLCPASRNFRPADYVAFYADREIKPSVAKVLHHRDNVEWTAAEAARLGALNGEAHRNDRKIARAITAGRAAGWTDGRYQVFLLTAPDHPDHIELSAALPHPARGRGSAFVQRHRYLSHHSLQSAADTTDL